MAFALSSTAFSQNGSIPTVFTCEGNDISPPLEWSGIPPGTKSLALVVADPDAPDPKAPKRTWTHWVLFNVPPATSSLPEGVKPGQPEGSRDGHNDWGRLGWGGPCPPIGRHRYFFQLYALDKALDATKRPTREQLEKEIQGHVLGKAELMGTYEKTKG